MSFLWTLIKDLKSNIRLVVELAKRDFQSAYVGSALGLLWSILEPLCTMMVMWFVFTKAAKFTPGSRFSYVAWLWTGLVFWYFINASISGTVGIFKSHAYLMRRWEFNIAILPFVGILTALFSHLIMLAILFVIYFVYGVPINIYWLQAIYYIFAVTCFVAGLSLITSSLSLFLRDIRNLIAVLLQLMIWVSPVYWEIGNLPENYQNLVKLNPLFHVISGYRNSFLNQTPFWADQSSLIYFWGFTALIWFLGILLYKKLRPHFGEVL
jgi:ABC-type polysaccharide/polyol phosphate export permease